VRLSKPFPELKAQQQIAGGEVKQLTRISLKPDQFISFKQFMLNVRLYLMGTKKHLIDPSTYRLVY